MKIERITFFALFALLISSITSFAGPASLDPDETLRLRAFIATNTAAAARFAAVRKAADRSLGDEPAPVQKINSQGHFDKDSLKIDTKAALRDVDKVESLGWAWAVTGDSRYPAKAREFILAWAKVNQPDGNAINETKFEPLIVGYDLTRDTFSEAERKIADSWLRGKADMLIAEEKGFGGNWPCHRLKIVGMVGYTIGDTRLITEAINGYRMQVAKDIQKNGACTDFYVRDALHYQLYSVSPLLTLARMGERRGQHLFDFHGLTGGSLHDAVDFVVPYAEGQKTHMEFANSKSSADSGRANAGQAEYAPHTWEPKASLGMFSTAAWFNPEYGKLVAKIDGKPDEVFYDWKMVINAISQPNTKQ